MSVNTDIRERISLVLSKLEFKLRTLTIGGSISVRLTSCFTGLDLTKQVKLLFMPHKQSSSIQTKNQVSCTVILLTK